MIDMGMTDHLVRLDHASLVALAFVVVIGLPHGAFDGAIARHLGYARTLVGLIKFITVYLGLAAAVVAVARFDAGPVPPWLFGTTR